MPSAGKTFTQNSLSMARLVIDTNSLLQCISRRSRYHDLWLSLLTNNPYTLFITPYYHFKLIVADPDDDKFVDCAVASNAKFIVTEDSHYDVLQGLDFPCVDVIKLDDIILRI